MKYYILYRVGKAKYIVNFHDGEKLHPDGSEFFDIAIFSNKNRMNIFVNELKRKGYKEV